MTTFTFEVFLEKEHVNCALSGELMGRKWWKVGFKELFAFPFVGRVELSGPGNNFHLLVLRVFSEFFSLSRRWVSPKLSLSIFRVHPQCGRHQNFFPLWVNNIPSYGSIIFCLSVHQLMDLWVVFPFGLLQIELLRTFTPKFLLEHLFSSLPYTPGSGTDGSWSNSRCNFLKNHLMHS